MRELAGVALGCDLTGFLVFLEFLEGEDLCVEDYCDFDDVEPCAPP